jgi:carbamoyltransferase
MIIVGLGGILSDAACAVLKNGTLVSAIEEKKIARRSTPGELPNEAIASCLKLARATPETVDCVAITRPFGEGTDTAMHLHIRSRFPNSRLVAVDHHAAHAAAAYYPSPFDDAAVLTLDRIGDFCCGARWHGHGNDLALEKELYYPDSLGDVYGRVTELLGFHSNSDEHKVQWLSTSGDDRFVAVFEDVLALDGQGWPRIDRSYFDSDRNSRGEFSEKFYSRIGVEDGEMVPVSLHAHIAAGIQRALENTVIRMAGDHKRVCLAGGLGLNALLVAALERDRDVFVQPAAGNAGTALGAALHAWHRVYGNSGRNELRHLYLGPEFTPEEVKQVLENCKLRFRYLLTTDEIIGTAVEQLNDQKIVAWMQGRMEFGPRALGNRSILASPLDPYSTENLNNYIKHREPFRKFAASVPAELAGEYFDVGRTARYLATVGRVKPAHRKTFETAILGRDLVRVHVVEERDNPLYYQLLHAAGKKTGLPVLYNTSFNLFNDPLVCSPRDAARGFFSSGIDAMVVGNFFLQK